MKDKNTIQKIDEKLKCENLNTEITQQLKKKKQLLTQNKLVKK